MSSTNKTTNYNLSQFIGSDKPAWLVDYNGDMSAIDTQMKANADAAAAAQTTANTADGKADTNASAISTLDSQINGASGVAADVVSLQGSVNTINSLIGNGEPTTTDKTLIGAINELDSDTGTLNTKIGNVPCVQRISVSVTADGVKTYRQLLDDLHAAIVSRLSDITTGRVVLSVIQGLAHPFVCNADFAPSYTGDFFAYGIAYNGTNNGLVSYSVRIRPENSTYENVDSATSTYAADTSTVPSSGAVIVAILHHYDVVGNL